MSNSLMDDLVEPVPLLSIGDTVGDAARQIIAAGMPALPVIDDDRRLCGIFGERELMEGLFPGYFGTLKYAGFVGRSLNSELERRSGCLEHSVAGYLNSERVEVPLDFSDAQLAETFLHHRVLILPVVDSERRVHGVVTRSALFRALVERLTNND